MKPKSHRKSNPKTSWEPLSQWYDGWMGQDGSRHHRQLAIPAVLELLDAQSGERILDLGCGQGVLAAPIQQAGAAYTGIDLSRSLIRIARKRHGKRGRFLVGDARALDDLPQIEAQSFDAVVFLLSIQDMQPLDAALRAAAWALRPSGRLVILMTHPCFRIPRQSGWGWDGNRKLQFRRVDRYLTPLQVPLKAYAQDGTKGVSRSFHRPLQAYINALGECGLLLDRICEIPSDLKQYRGERRKAKKRADEEIPLFLGIRAWKTS
ncbi:MAG: class I SAM-dependent methyltransferase [Anaerolineales bacterium]|nr:class I SAM-dependent methyltransferase [Anaerolineales bacterium]